MNNNYIEIKLSYLGKEILDARFHSNGVFYSEKDTNPLLDSCKCDVDIASLIINSIENNIIYTDDNDFNKIYNKIFNEFIIEERDKTVNSFLFRNITNIGNFKCKNLEKFTLSIRFSKIIFIINGSGGVGKDTFIKFLDEIIFRNGGRLYNYSSIEPIFRMYQRLNNKTHFKSELYRDDKEEQLRYIYSKTKEMLDNCYDFTLKTVSTEIEDFLKKTLHDKNNEFSDILIIHVREPKNIEKIVNKFNIAHAILMENNNVKPIITNDSDKNVKNYNYDILIENNGDIDDLRNIAKLFINRLYVKDISIIDLLKGV